MTCSEDYNTVCVAGVFRRLQYSVYSRCVQNAAVRCVWQMCSEICNMLCTADVFRRLKYSVYDMLRGLEYSVYSRYVQKAAICCAQQLCSEVCSPLCSADVFKRLPYPAFWSLTSMVVLLIRGSLLWQTLCTAVLTHLPSRLCGRAVHCTGDRAYVPASLRHLDTPLWDELLFSCFNYVWKVLSSTCRWTGE